LQGAILPTDYDWYENLSAQDGLSEVNFWRPSDRRGFRASVSSPFFFKLKAPHNAICGFGLFKQYTPLPIWLAWDAFERANGCDSLQELEVRIGNLRSDPGISGGSARIGCIQIVDPIFLLRKIGSSSLQIGTLISKVINVTTLQQAKVFAFGQTA